MVKLLDDFDAAYSFIGNEGPRFWFQTDLQAPRGKVIEIDTANPSSKNWKSHRSGRQGDATGEQRLVNNRFILNYLKDAYTQVKIYNTAGKFLNDGCVSGHRLGGRFRR